MPRHERSHMGRECYPRPEDPADQPYPPGCGADCDNLPSPCPPTLECPPHWHPDPACHCPTLPSSSPKCIEDLIDQQSTDADAATTATKLKDDLTAILEETKKGHESYTREFYDTHIDLWVRLDSKIAELLHTLECNVDCWKCVLECYVCPLLADLHRAEVWLYGDRQLYPVVNDLYDLQYWHSKNKAAKERRFKRIDDYLRVWKDPVYYITEAMKENDAIYEQASNYPSKEFGKAIYDVFLKLVPLHLAIAPPRGSCWETRIDKRFTNFCEFGRGPHDHCCGPDLGRPSLRQRLIGPQPYLIDPCDYLKVICCLMEKRWTPARVGLNNAESEYNTVTRRIDRLTGKFNEGWKTTLETTAEAVIPPDVECCEFDPRNADDDDCGRRPRRHCDN